MANEVHTTLTPTEQYLAEIKAHKTYLGTVIKESQVEYSKQLLSLSSAILAVSVAFLKNLVTVKTATWFCLLYTAWGLFAATIFFTLVAIRISIKAHQIYKDDIEKELEGQTDLKGKTWRDWAVPLLSFFTTLFFIGGVACLVVFAVTNVQRERSMSDQTYDTPTLPSGITKDDQKDWVEVQRIKPVKTPPPPAQPPAEKPPEQK